MYSWAEAASAALNTAATTATAAQPRPQVWHHHALTYDHTSGVWRLYLDGQQVGTGTTTASALARAGDGGAVQIGGARYGGSQQRAYGHICDARIANVVRSAAWCREVYRRGVGVWEGS